jgi:hypothetical protein
VGSAWWLPELNPSLSQGDIIRVLPVWIPAPSLIALDKRTFPIHSDEPTSAQKRTAWVESAEPKIDDSGFGHYLARTRLHVAIVLTHDCQLDKDTKRARIQLAATADVDGLNAEERTKVMNQGSLSKLVLPDVPLLGSTYYADLRILFTVDKRLIVNSMRAASMTEEAKFRLQTQIVAYFTDRQMPAKTK